MPESKVAKVNLAYDIEELTDIMREFDEEVSKLMFIQAYKKQMKSYAHG